MVRMGYRKRKKTDHGQESMKAWSHVERREEIQPIAAVLLSQALMKLADCCPQQRSRAVSTLAICFKAIVLFGGKSCHCLYLPCSVSVLRMVLVHIN